MEKAVRKLVIDQILHVDETDCQVIALVHDENHTSQFCVCAWNNVIPNMKHGAVVEGILSIELVMRPEKCCRPLTHTQNNINIQAVVEIVQVLNGYGDALVTTDFDEIPMVVVFEQRESFAEGDRVYIDGELWLQDPEHIDEIASW